MSRQPDNRPWLTALYALLIRLYPRPFRDTYGPEMAQVFAAAVAEAAPRGRLALATLALRELGGLLAGLAREHGQACLESAARAPALTAILGTFYLGFAAFYIALDISVGLSLFAWASLAFILTGALPGAAVLLLRREPAVSLTLALFLALVLALPSLDLGPRKAFLRAAAGIQPAMSLAAIDQQMRAFDRVPARPGDLDAAGQVIYRHQFGPGDLDAVTVRFVDGRVVDSQLILD